MKNALIENFNMCLFLQDPVPERGSGTPGLSGLRDSSRQQPSQSPTVDQSSPLNGASLLPNDVTLEQLQPPVSSGPLGSPLLKCFILLFRGSLCLFSLLGIYYLLSCCFSVSCLKYFCEIFPS